MSFIETFTNIKNKIIDTDTSIISGTIAIQVKLTGMDEGVFYLEVKNGILSVEPYDYFDNDAVIIIDPLDLNKILDGKLEPVNAFNTGKLKIEGNFEKTMLLNNLIIKNKKDKKEKAKTAVKTKIADIAEAAVKTTDKAKATVKTAGKAKTANKTKTGGK